MSFITDAADILGSGQVLTGADLTGYDIDFLGKYPSKPLCLVRPGTTEEVSAILRLANDSDIKVVPISGNTGLSGGTYADGAVLVSLERLSAIEEIRVDAQVAIVEAGVVLETLREAVGAHGLSFPVTFGAQGTAMIGGVLSTNAGGSNVLRYGNARAQVLGIEAVLADGRVMDLMTPLIKDNTGYDLRDLMIGAEGTLGIITRAALKLVPKPEAFATAMIASPDLTSALLVLNQLRAATGGAVEAFEYMPRGYIEDHLALDPTAREPLHAPYEVNIMVELGGDATIGAQLEHLLGEALTRDEILDAVIAQSEGQRREMWARREAAARIAMGKHPVIVNDIALPLDRVATFLERAPGVLAPVDPDATTSVVAHLGDGNIHYSVHPNNADAGHMDRVMEAIEELVAELGGTFSAEHGIGLSKRPSMARHKDPVALDVMRAIKATLDPKGTLNPGKVLPD